MGNGPNLSLAFKTPLNIFLRIIFSRKKKKDLALGTCMTHVLHVCRTLNFFQIKLSKIDRYYYSNSPFSFLVSTLPPNLATGYLRYNPNPNTILHFDNLNLLHYY